MDTLTLPLDQEAIQRILPHRFPFLFVDRIVELEPDRRIVGLMTVSHGERFLSRLPDGRLAVPPTILTEAIAQVGAVLVLTKPEHRGKLVFFMGIDRVRYRHPVYAGDVVRLEVTARRFRSRMGQFEGTVRVGDRIAAHGVMTFAMTDPDGLMF